MSTPVWVHCNKCFHSEDKQFYLTNCGHILCKRCSRYTREAKICPACKSPVPNVMPLDSKTPSNIAMYFKPTFAKELQEIIEYQNQQFDDFLEHENAKYNHNKREYMRLRDAYEEQKRKHSKLAEKLHSLRSHEEAVAYPGGSFGIMNDTPRSANSSKFAQFQPNIGRAARDVPMVHQHLSSMMSEASSEGNHPFMRPGRSNDKLPKNRKF